jgi:hypothetical protein
MEFLDILKAERNINKASSERESERYTRIDIDFSDTDYSACSMKKLGVFGDYLAKAVYTGNKGTATIRLGHRHAPAIPLSEFRKTYALYDTIYLTTTDTSGHLILYVGRAFSSEIDPVSGDAVKILNTTGAEINAVQDKRFKSHTLDHQDRKVEVTINVADPVSGVIAAPVSLKVKWAIISVDTADALFGGIDVTNLAGSHPGVRVGSGGSLTVEYIDLKDLWFVNEDGAVKPYITVLYAGEE